jgi:hypothetical protein
MSLPTFWGFFMMYIHYVILHDVQVQFSPCKVFINDLKWLKDEVCLKLSGS